jgi:Holliday junction resolvasome RuvABC endonuclease subunit
MALNPAGQGFPTLEQIAANPILGPNREKPLTTLALDLSSSCVGWAVGVDATRKLERYGKFVFKGTAGIGEKLVSFEEYLSGLIANYWPEHLLVERPSTHGATAERHMELLGITRKVWFDATHSEIEKTWIIHPKTIKAAMKVERGANHTQNKIIMVNKINQLYSMNLKFDKGSKYKSDDDTADAIAVLTTFWRRTAKK